jgi:hypothetical protein
MTHLGPSDDSQQPKPDPYDLADLPEPPIPATKEVVLSEFAKQIGPAVRGIGADPGVQSAISKMISARDLGLYKGINQHAAALAAGVHKLSIPPAARGIGADPGVQSAISKMISTTAIAASHQNLLRSIGGVSAGLVAPLANLTGVSAGVRLADLLLRWREVADSGVGVLRALARAAYKAALDARAAVLRGDDGPVTQFISTWLDLRTSPERVEAVSAALLEEGWDAGIPDDPAYLIADLRKRTARQGRVLRPIWETQLNRRPVGMLDEPVCTSNGTLLTAADLVPGAQSAEDLVLADELEEERLRRVLNRLKPDELLVTNVYAQRGELSWAEAARVAGAPDAVGERIRRKLSGGWFPSLPCDDTRSPSRSARRTSRFGTSVAAAGSRGARPPLLRACRFFNPGPQAFGGGYAKTPNDAIKALSPAIRRTRAGLKDPKRPGGSFIFAEPSGVGKAELSKTLGEFLTCRFNAPPAPGTLLSNGRVLDLLRMRWRKAPHEPR